jgi:hypothetical protein
MPPTEDDLNELSAAFLLSLNNAIDDAQAVILKSIRRLEKRIITAFKDLKTSDKGQLLSPRVNLKQAQKIHQDLIEYFEESYNVGVKSIKGFDEIAQAIKDTWLDVDDAIDYTGIDTTIMDALADQKLAEFMRFGDNAREKIAGAMYDHVAAAGEFADLVTAMRAILGTGKDKRGNTMARYAELWANDAIMNFQQAVHVLKAQEAGLRSYLYYGNIIKTTRPFCIDRAGHVFSKKTIESWNDLSWQGKRGPPLIYRGGWNCRHHFRPVKQEWLPKGGIPVADYFVEHGIEIERGTTLPKKKT